MHASTVSMLNQDTIDEVKDGGRILEDYVWLNENKVSVKSSILQYLTDQDLGGQTEKDTRPLKYQNLQMINFIFLKKQEKSHDVEGVNESTILTSLVIMNNEISDMFDLSVTKANIHNDLYSELEKKNEEFFIDQILKFSKTYLKKDNNERYIIKDNIIDDWLDVFPKDKSYQKNDMILNHITKKVGFFLSLIESD